jgi:hypothetical protein
MRIVLLGASGNAGREITRLLTPTLGAGDVVVLAGRDQKRLAATAAVTTGPATIQVETVDAGDDAAVQRLVAQATIVVVTASVPERIPALVRIVAEAGADWFDTMLSTRTKIEAFRHLEPQLLESGQCFVTDGGFHPGLPAAMVRWADRRIDALETAEVYGGMRLDWRADTLSESTIIEMLSEFADFDMTTYRDGGWRTLRWSQCPTVDFGLPIGRKSCVPMYLAEMESLPTDIPTLRRCGFFVGGFSPLMDYVALPVIMGLAKVPALQRMTVALTRWSFGHLANDPPPHRISIRLSAAGLREGLPATARMEISGDDGYLLTAAPVVACLRRLLDGSIRRPGVWLQGHLVDPDSFFTDLASFGLTVEAEVSPQGSPAA